MSDYISREAAIEKIREAGCTDCGGSSGTICGFCDFENAVRLVNGLPTADVEPVRHGRWVDIWCNYTCSECEYMWEDSGYKTPFCPICGAKMDLEGGNGT